jgi:hypothetical protein
MEQINSNPLNWDWIVGFMEGEGSFLVQNIKRKTKIAQVCCITIGQRDREILDNINKFIGGWGYVNYSKPKPYSLSKNGCYYLQFYRVTKLREIAPEIEKRLQTWRKKEQFKNFYNSLTTVKLGYAILENHWTKQEDDLVMANQFLPREETAKILREQGFKRTAKQISTRISRIRRDIVDVYKGGKNPYLHTFDPDKIERPRRWTRKEDVIIMENRKHTGKELCQLLIDNGFQKRAPASIRERILRIAKGKIECYKNIGGKKHEL